MFLMIVLYVIFHLGCKFPWITLLILFLAFTSYSLCSYQIEPFIPLEICTPSCFVNFPKFSSFLTPSSPSKRALLITSCINHFFLFLLDLKSQLPTSAHKKFLPWLPIALTFHHFNFLLFSLVLYVIPPSLPASIYPSTYLSIHPSIHLSIHHSSI